MILVPLFSMYCLSFGEWGGLFDVLRIQPGWWCGTFFIFPYIGNVIIPIDEVIFFRGVAQPPTSSIFWRLLV